MTLAQNGDKVTGTYIHDDGKVVGTVSGNTLTGTWSESPSYNPPDDAGDFVLTLSADGKTITGNWRYGSNTGTWDGTWEGTRQ
jgi:ribosomal protein L13